MANVVEIIIRGIDKTKEGFTSPVKNLNDLGKAVDKVKPFFIAMATTAAAAFTAMAHHAIESADELGKLAQKAGTTVEVFSSLAYAAGQSDLGNVQLAKGFKEISKNLSEAVNQASPAAGVFQSLGINIRDANGKIISADAALLQIADRFADMPDGVNKVTAATKLFGDKLGQDMIPFLNQGAEAIQKLQHEAKVFGLVVSGETAKSAEEFNDDLRKLKSMLEGIVKQIVAEFLPTAAKMLTAFIEWAKASGALEFVTGTLVDIFKTFGYTARVTMVSVQALSDIFIGLGKVAGSAGAAMMAAVEAGGAKAGEYAAILEEKLKGNESNADFMEKNMAAAKGKIDAFKAAVELTAKEAGDAWNTALERFKKGPVVPTFGEHESPGSEENPIKIRKFGEPVITQFGSALPSGQTMDAYKLEQDMILATQQAHLEAFGSKMTLDQQMREAQLVKEAEEKMRFEERMRQISALGLEEGENFGLIEKAYKEHSERMQVIGRQMAQQQTRNYIAIADQSASILGSMAQTAQAFGRKGFVAYQALAVGQAIVSTAAGAARALADYPWPLSAVMAAAVAAAGAAQIATIVSQKPPQAHAGATYVPEDSTYLLKQGERVLAPEQNQDFTEFMENGGSTATVILQIDGYAIGQVLGRLSRDGRLTIDERAVIAA